MGLPRSSLLKSKSPEVIAPAAIAAVPPPPAFVMAPPVASPFAVAPTVPAMSPFAPAPPAPSAGPEAAQDAAPSTLKDPFLGEAAGAEIDVEVAPSVRAPFASAPSKSDLLERAAALGPVRMTWESIVLPNDPILLEKLAPRVAERRARLTRVVKGALGACLAVCIVALGVSALSGGTPDAQAATPGSVAKAIPSKAVVSIEALDGAKRAKAAQAQTQLSARRAPVATPAAARGKRR